MFDRDYARRPFNLNNNTLYIVSVCLCACVSGERSA